MKSLGTGGPLTGSNAQIFTAAQQAQMQSNLGLGTLIGGNAGRNKFLNPLFAVNQRGFTSNTGAGFFFDRWQAQVGTGGGTRTITPYTMTDADRAAIGDEEADTGLQYTCAGGSAAGDFDLYTQNTENVRRFSGKTVVVSFWAAVASGSAKLGVSGTQSFGTGGSPSSTITGIMPNTVTLSTVLTRYAVPVTFPSSAGKTLGSNKDSSSGIAFWLSSGSTNATASGGVGVQSATFRFWGKQLEVGSVATALEKLDYEEVLAQCERSCYAGAWGMGGYIESIGLNYFNIQSLPVSMLRTPQMSYTLDYATNVATAAPSFIGNNGIQSTVTGAVVGGFYAGGTFIATCDL